MALMSSTRRYSFRAVHSLNTGVHSEKLHGHEYLLEVSVVADPDQVSDFSELDEAVRAQILNPLHGHDLSLLVPVATGEVLVEWIHAELLKSNIRKDLLGVALQETRKNRFVSAGSCGYLL